jgi:hypothetical protein
VVSVAIGALIAVVLFSVAIAEALEPEIARRRRRRAGK